jgi:uncharacterized protein YrrD
MLYPIRALTGFKLRPFDGEMGSIEDFCFDREQWRVRYILAGTRSWMLGRTVLISPASLGQILWNQRVVQVMLTREQIERSPSTNEAPLTRTTEAELARHYNWPSYWTAGAAKSPPAMPGPGPQEHTEPSEASRLLSVAEVIGLHVHATDGSIGHIDDLVFDELDWTIRFLVVDTRNWWPGQKVLLTPAQVTGLEPRAERLDTPLSREQIRHAPPYDPDDLSDQYVRQLEEYYDQR